MYGISEIEGRCKRHRLRISISRSKNEEKKRKGAQPRLMEAKIMRDTRFPVCVTPYGYIKGGRSSTYLSKETATRLYTEAATETPCM